MPGKGSVETTSSGAILQALVDRIANEAVRQRTDVSHRLPDSVVVKAEKDGSRSLVGVTLPANVSLHETEGGVFLVATPGPHPDAVH